MVMITMMVMRSHDKHDDAGDVVDRELPPTANLQFQALRGSGTGAVALGAITDAAAKVLIQARVLQSFLFSVSGCVGILRASFRLSQQAHPMNPFP